MAAKTVSISVFIITVIIASIITGLGVYFAKPTAAPAPPQTTTVTKTITSTSAQGGGLLMGKGLTIYWIGGAAGDPFDARLYKGATDAAQMLGVKLVYVHTGWDPTKMVSEFKKAISLRPDGIVVMGHPGYDALAPLFAEAAKDGIKVTLANVDIPQLREKYWFTGYVGQDLYQAGYTLAEAALKKFPDRLKAGARVAIFSGDWSHPARALRARGVEDAFKKAGLIVDRVAHPSSVYGNPAEGLNYVSGYLAKHPDVACLVFDGGGTTASAENYLKSVGYKPGQVIVIGFDLTPGSLKGLKDGYVQLVIDQQPYLQGFLTVLNLVLSIKYHFAGLYINTGGAVLGPEDVSALETLVNEGYR